MRKIEQKMLRAIKLRKNWRSGNTSVAISPAGGMEVRLHGNLIAELYPNSELLRITSAGRETRTTKSRLNALLFGLSFKIAIVQRNWEWYIVDIGNSKNRIPFTLIERKNVILDRHSTVESLWREIENGI